MRTFDKSISDTLRFHIERKRNDKLMTASMVFMMDLAGKGVDVDNPRVLKRYEPQFKLISDKIEKELF